MNPAALIPAPDSIPVAWGWFEGLGILTFTLHILMVNILVGGALLAAWPALTDTGNPAAGPLSNKLPTIFALTVNFGVAPLLFLQVIYGQFFYTSAVFSAVWWLCIILFLIAGYYAMYIHQARHKADPSRSPVFLLIGLGLAICISLVLTNVFTTMNHPDLWAAWFNNPHGTILNFFEGDVVPRYLHFLVASLAVGGLFTALLAERESGMDPETAARVQAKGMKIFTAATLVQTAVGLWWLIVLQRPVMLGFMGDNVPATALLVISVVLTFPVLAAGFANKPKSVIPWLFLLVLAMVGVRAMVRSLTLVPYFSPAELPMRNEASPLIFFLAVLVIGLAVVAYMLRLAFGPKRPSREV